MGRGKDVGVYGPINGESGIGSANWVPYMYTPLNVPNATTQA
jgi:hypothetical protein